MSSFNKNRKKNYSAKKSNNKLNKKPIKNKNRSKNNKQNSSFILIKSKYSNEIFNDLVNYVIETSKTYAGINKFDENNVSHIYLLKKFINSFLINKNRKLIKYSKDFNRNEVNLSLKYYYNDLQDLKKIINDNFKYIDNDNYINKSDLVIFINELKQFFSNQNYYELDLQIFDKLKKFIKKQSNKVKFKLNIDYMIGFREKYSNENNLSKNCSDQKSSLVYKLNEFDYETRWYISKSKILLNVFQIKQIITEFNGNFSHEINYRNLFKSGYVEEFLRNFDELCCIELMRYIDGKMPLVSSKEFLNFYGPLHIQNLYETLSFQAINPRWILFSSNDLIENNYVLNVNDLKNKSIENLREFVFQLFSAEELTLDEQILMRNRTDTKIVKVKRGMEQDFVEIYQDENIKKLVNKLMTN